MPLVLRQDQDRVVWGKSDRPELARRKNEPTKRNGALLPRFDRRRPERDIREILAVLRAAVECPRSALVADGERDRSAETTVNFDNGERSSRTPTEVKEPRRIRRVYVETRSWKPHERPLLTPGEGTSAHYALKLSLSPGRGHLAL